MSFITKFIDFIGGLFKKVIPEVKTFVNYGIELIENIKKIVDSEAADVLTALIPGELDDLIKDKIRAYLPKLLADLKGVQDSLSDQEIADYLKSIENLGSDAQAILKHGIASAVNNLITDQIGSISQAFITTEVVYKGKEAEAEKA